MVKTYPASSSAVAALEDDPFYRSICAPYDDDTVCRRAVLAKYFDYSMQEGRELGRCVHLADEARGVAVWLLPQSPELESQAAERKRTLVSLDCRGRSRRSGSGTRQQIAGTDDRGSRSLRRNLLSRDVQPTQSLVLPTPRLRGRSAVHRAHHRRRVYRDGSPSWKVAPKQVKPGIEDSARAISPAPPQTHPATTTAADSSAFRARPLPGDPKPR